jgi:hypothetical protein
MHLVIVGIAMGTTLIGLAVPRCGTIERWSIVVGIAAIGTWTTRCAIFVV